MSMAIVGPYYSVEAREKGLSDSLIGLIFATNQIGGFLTTLILGKVMILQRKLILFLGIIIVIISLLGFAFCIYIEDFTTFLLISLLSRFLQGVVISQSNY